MKEKQKYKKMNQIIKSRIEEINRGKIPEGYKKTSVGIVPIEWTEHTLGDIFKFKNGINKEKEAFGQGTPIVNYTDVWKKRGLKAEDIKGRVVLSKNEIQNYEVKCGDVFFTRTSETIEEIGYSSVLLDDIENAIFSGFVLRARPYNNLVSREYHQYCYSEPQMRHEIIKRSSMTTRALTSGSMLSQVAINLPSHREQSKIAEILMKWDEAIELYNQYIEKLKQLKSIWLKKMFPKKGERVPEWRFKGFTDAWEQRKLGDVVQITMGQSPDGSTYSDEPSDYILVQGNADLQNGWVCPRIWTTQITKKADAGDLIMSVRAPAGAMGKTAYNAVIGRGVAAIKGNEFIYQLLVKMDADGFWKTLSCGSTFESLNSDNIKNAEVKIPTTAEQIKIGGYFQQLDNLITLHQCKVEKIKAQQKVLQKYLLNGIVRV